MGDTRYEPKLRIAASGRNGSGYAIPTRPDDKKKPLRVVGVTTALKAIDKPGVLQWSLNNLAAWAAVNAGKLLDMSEEQAFKWLQFYTGWAKSSDFDSPMKEMLNASDGVLNDLAELGSITHTSITDVTTTGFMDDLVRDEHVEMMGSFLTWWDEHQVEVIASECTVVGNGYAGTFDAIWRIDGVVYLLDFKTSRATRDEHFAQLAALGAAESMMVETTEDDPRGVLYDSKKWGKTYWYEEPLPDFQKYGILHLRPEADERGSFCVLKEIPHEIIDAAFDIFTGALAVCEAQYKIKQVKKGCGFDD